MNSKFKALIKATDNNHLNRRNTPNSTLCLSGFVAMLSVLYNCREASTNLLFIMQNEPNFPDDQMNVNKVLTMDYGHKSNWTLGENEPNTNPIKANFQKAQIFVTTFLTKEYENISNWAICENKPNTNPIQSQYKPKTNPTCRGVARPKSQIRPWRAGSPPATVMRLSIRIALVLLIALTASARAQRQMENLTRGIVAVKQPDGVVYVGWRLFGTDPETLAFNLYRVAAGGTPVMINENPLAGATNYFDRGANTNQPLQYFVRPVLNGKELAPSKAVPAWDKNYLEIPIKRISRYRPGDASIADLDGDGEYEIVLHLVSGGRDNAFAGITGTPIFDAYELDGTHMWRINLGINIRDGEHYTQFMVYDLDGDGKAEMACKTADGTTDGTGQVIGDKSKDWRTHKEGDRTHGRILDGPEYFTIFDGRTGAALKTVDYIPNRYPINGWGGIGGNGGNDNYGNRCDRFLACVAYLDGVRPSVVMCRGVYGRTVLAAWDWRDGKLTSRWVFDSGISYPPFKDASPYSGMGGHSLSVADVDNDGKDEIVYHAMVIDDNGKGLYSTQWRHGDSMHISDMYPDRPGLEVFTIHENEGDTVRFQSPGTAMRNARTGKPIWKHSPGVDVDAGMAADIDPRHRGYEAWGGPGGLRDSRGSEMGPCPRSSRFVIWWDGDLLRELLAGSDVKKWNWETGAEEELFTTKTRAGGRGPNIVGDFIGDWREELLMTSPDGQALRLYTTTIPTEHRIYTLMHDPQYRLAIAWQNVVYNKPPHPGFFLGNKMAPPPRPNIYLIGEGEAIAAVRAQK